MYFRTACLIIVITTGLGCRRAPHSPASPLATTTSEPSDAAQLPSRNAPSLQRTLCRGRQSCTILRERAAQSLEIKLVDLSLMPVQGAPEGTCHVREYWLAGPNSPILLATDCQEQWGADEQGPAETEIRGNVFYVHYIEFQADDSCEHLVAEIDLTTATVRKYQRRGGVIKNEVCHAKKAELMPRRQGSGAADSPLVVLH